MLNLPTNELKYLRELAKHQAELATLPAMQTRRKLWTDMNDCVPGARPPFAMESNTFDRDFMPESILRCESDSGRWWERLFLRQIRHHEVLNDDHVCQDTIDIGWHIWQNEFGVDIPTEYTKDSEGHTLGYHFDCPIKDLNEGMGSVKPATFGVNRENTLAHKTDVEEAFGDIMPVRLRGDWTCGGITNRLMRIMAQDTFFVSMYECPDKMHEVMSMLRDNLKRFGRWMEAEGMLTVNNGNQVTCGTCFNFTTRLPKYPPHPPLSPASPIPDSPIPQFPNPIKLSDMWGGMDSQETVGVSPGLFHEFCFPYYADLASMFGFVYWGCCEPVHTIWEKSLSILPNLRAVSISRWTDEEYMGESLAGRDIVYSRKPDPNHFALHHDLDEDAWRKHIRTSLDVITKNNIPAQFVVRDLYTLKGNLPKARRAIDIAREEIDRFYGVAE